jgi:hypothetical protein
VHTEAIRCRRVAALPGASWAVLHVLLYLAIGLSGVILWQAATGNRWVDIMVLLMVAVGWYAPLIAIAAVAASLCLGVLRLVSDLRWYWWRLSAVLLFAFPFPFILYAVDGPATALPVAAIQLATALLLVQPRT